MDVHDHLEAIRSIHSEAENNNAALTAQLALTQAALDQEKQTTTNIVRQFEEYQLVSDAQIAVLNTRIAGLIRANSLEAFRLKPVFSVDPSWTRAQLSDVQKPWYDALWNNIRLPINDVASQVAVWGPETIGFTYKQHIIALLFAMEATHGSPEILDEIYRLQKPLRDRIVSMPAPTGKDKSFLASLYATLAWVFHVNRDVKPEWAQCADDFKNVLIDSLSNMLPGSVPSDDLAHSFSASFETAFYLWKLTGDNRYKTTLDRMSATFVNESFLKGGVIVWDHRMPIVGLFSLGIQMSTYARYTIPSLITLHMQGHTVIPPYLLVATTLNVIHERGPMSLSIDGVGLETALTKQGTSNYGFVAPYDLSGEVLRRTSVFYTNENVRSIYPPAAMLWSGISPRR